MYSEKKLRATAADVTGDDSIIDVALLQPRGAAAARGAGAAAGSLAGGDNTWGSAAGAGAGAAGGQALAAAASELPLNTCVAITPTRVYLVGLPMGGDATSKCSLGSAGAGASATVPKRWPRS